jgi:hypothetical protein
MAIAWRLVNRVNWLIGVVKGGGVSSDCNRAYVEQTGRDFRTIYKEQLRAFQYNTQQSKLAQHLKKTWTRIRQHKKYHGDCAVPQERHTPKHIGKILYTQGILKY